MCILTQIVRSLSNQLPQDIFSLAHLVFLVNHLCPKCHLKHPSRPIPTSMKFISKILLLMMDGINPHQVTQIQSIKVRSSWLKSILIIGKNNPLKVKQSDPTQMITIIGNLLTIPIQRLLIFIYLIVSLPKTML